MAKDKVGMTGSGVMGLKGDDLWSACAIKLLGYKKDSYEYWHLLNNRHAQASTVRNKIREMGLQGEFIKLLSTIICHHTDEIIADDGVVFEFMCAPAESQAKAALLAVLFD